MCQQYGALELTPCRSIWKAFIPFPHLQIFQRGAYYAIEVVPDALAVISLNTMYFYDSNKGTKEIGVPTNVKPGRLQRSGAANSRTVTTLGTCSLIGSRCS
jgi:hypothetical protein